MTDSEEIKLRGESARGAQAKALLGNEIYQDAIRQLEDAIIERWKESPIRDFEGQQQLRLLHKLLRDLLGYIAEIAQTGKLAQISLDNERTLRQRSNDAVRAFRR